MIWKWPSSSSWLAVLEEQQGEDDVEDEEDDDDDDTDDRLPLLCLSLFTLALLLASEYSEPFREPFVVKQLVVEVWSPSVEPASVDLERLKAESLAEDEHNSMVIGEADLLSWPRCCWTASWRALPCERLNLP